MMNFEDDNDDDEIKYEVDDDINHIDNTRILK